MTRLPRPLEDLAKVLTYLLCHRPDEFGLVLDPEGFVSVKQLLQALAGEKGLAHAAPARPGAADRPDDAAPL